VLERPEPQSEVESLTWEKKGIFPVFGLLATMLGVIYPERRAAALVRGRTRSAVLFFVASFLPVAIGAFAFAHALGGVEQETLLYVARGVIASLAGAVALVGSFTSMAQAEGAEPKSALRAALFLAWLVPLFLVDFGPFATTVLAHPPERAETFAALCALAPLLLALVGLEAAAKHGAGLAPRFSLLMGVVPVALAFAVGRVALAAGGV